MKKLISWNVNGLRACVGKGFMDFFNEVDADVFCIQESKLQEGQIDLDLPAITSTGTMLRKKAIPAQPCSQKKSLSLFPMALALRNMTMKAESSQLNSQSITLSPAILQTPKMVLPDWITV